MLRADEGAVKKDVGDTHLEDNLLAVLHALVDLHFNDLFLALDLLPAAVGASVLGLDGGALAVALRALLLHLLHHPGGDLAGDKPDSVPGRNRKGRAKANGHKNVARARTP